MFGRFTYLLWLVLYIGLPLLGLLHWRTIIWPKRRALGWTVLGSLVGGWAWDAAAVRYDVWYYDPEHIVGLWLFGLPIEEWLWIVGVTLMFGCLTIVVIDRLGIKGRT